MLLLPAEARSQEPPAAPRVTVATVVGMLAPTVVSRPIEGLIERDERSTTSVAPQPSTVAEYKIDATFVSLDLPNSVLTYASPATPGTQTSHASPNALAAAARLKPGDKVVLHCHAEPSAQAATVIDEVKKKTSHWKRNTLIVFGVLMVIGAVGLATAPCNHSGSCSP